MSSPHATPTVRDLEEHYPDTALATTPDVTDADSVRAAVRAAEDRFGSVDVLLNNAGYGYRAAVEEGDDADVARRSARTSTAPSAPSRPSCPACAPVAPGPS